METKLAVVSLWAEDVPATTHFYRDVIGLRLLPHHGDSPHFDLGGIYLTILKGRPRLREEPVPARFPIIAFAVNDLDEAIQRLGDHGVDLPYGIEGKGGSRWVMFKDPGGNLIELAQLPE